MGNKSKLLAGLLAILCPGLGQLYNGDGKKAFFPLGLLVLALLLLHSPLTLVLGPVFILLIYLFMLVVWLWSLFDAVRAPKRALFAGRGKRIAAYVAFFLVVPPLLGAAKYAAIGIGGVDFYSIPAASMAPGILAGDLVVVDRRAFRGTKPVTGEVALFSFPRDSAITYIKRVAAVEGQIIQGKEKTLYVDGRKIERERMTGLDGQFTRDDGTMFAVFREKISDRSYSILVFEKSDLSGDFGPVTVPEGHFFSLGDHRDRSSDSRLWGNISYDKLIARPAYVYFSKDPESGRIRWDRISKKVE